jgi:lipopolysaccharide transport system permease protein
MLETRVYQSAKNYSISSVVKESLQGYKQSFYLAKQLAKRDISAQYRQSILGIFWAIAPLIMNAFVWIFLNGTGTIKLAQTSIPYPLYVIIGTTLWAIFTDCILLTITSVNANKSIITKINFHKEALVTLGFIKLLFNLLIKFILVIVLMLYYHVPISSSIIYFIPFMLISMLALVSIGILITPIGILYQDISRAVPIVMQILMYVTPVVYLMPKTGFMKTLMELNPFTYLVVNLRNALTGFPIENLPVLVIYAILSIVLFLVSIVVYRIAMPIITERMSA